jgi:hypothetical protein
LDGGQLFHFSQRDTTFGQQQQQAAKLILLGGRIEVRAADA